MPDVLHGVAIQTLAFVGTFAVHGTVILTAAWLLAKLARRSDATREEIWKVALVASIASPVVQMSAGTEPIGGHLFSIEAVVACLLYTSDAADD